MTLQIESRSVYGNTLYYPLGDPARAIQKLTGKKTLTLSDMASLQALGVHCELNSKQNTCNSTIARRILITPTAP